MVALAEPERSLKSFLEFRTVVKRLECDLVHIPNLFSIPRALPCPYVMTVHDMLEHMSRAREQSGFWRSLHFQLTKRVLRGAAREFSPYRISPRTKSRSCSGFLPNALKWSITQLTSVFFAATRPRPTAQLIAERYLVTYPFLLYAGRISPHKNVVRMIEAFSALKTELEKDQAFPDLKLIIIGDDLSGNPDLRRTVIRSGVQNDVRFLGFVPIEVLRIFYDAAKIFVFPRSTRVSDCLRSRPWPMAPRW